MSASSPNTLPKHQPVPEALEITLRRCEAHRERHKSPPLFALHRTFPTSDFGLGHSASQHLGLSSDKKQFRRKLLDLSGSESKSEGKLFETPLSCEEHQIHSLLKNISFSAGFAAQLEAEPNFHRFHPPRPSHLRHFCRISACFIVKQPRGNAA